MKRRISRLKINYFYVVSLRVLQVITPFITAPYIARKFGPEGIGQNSYIYSIAYYFVIFSLLGNQKYGNRECAKVKDNTRKLSNVFWGIYSVQLTFTFILTLLYILICLSFSEEIQIIGYIYIIYVLSAGFDISWFYYGLEKFQFIFIRGVIIKLLGVISIFLFIRKNEDLWIYALIISLSALVSNALLWITLRRTIFSFVQSLEHINFKDYLKHLKNSSVLFIPVVAVSIYKIMDKIMLGGMAGMSQTGYYENAEKIINILLGILTSLSTVLLPKISYLVGQKEYGDIKSLFIKSVNYTVFLGFGMTFGIIAISSNFIRLFFGAEFLESIPILKVLAPTLITIGLGDVIVNQYLIPRDENKLFIISVSVGACLNLILNILLIPRFFALGAAYATLFTEIVVLGIQYSVIKHTYPLKQIFVNTWRIIISSFLMFYVIKSIKIIYGSIVLTLIVQVVLGVFLYFLIYTLLYLLPSRRS